MWRVVLWLLPEYASIPESERRAMDHGLRVGLIGTIVFALVVTMLEMMLEALVPPSVLGVVRPVAFITLALLSNVAITRTSYARSSSFYKVQAALKASLRFQAMHDSLTGLPNRGFLREHLARQLGLGGTVGLLLIDLDRFKEVNDRLGHAAGDEVLVEVARRLRVYASIDDVVARLGGDEFALMVASLGEEGALRLLAREVQGALEAPVMLSAGSAQIGASIGVAVFAGDGGDVDGLLRAADLDMYRSKAARRRNIGRRRFRPERRSA